MSKKELLQVADFIAEKTAKIVIERMSSKEAADVVPEYVNVIEAARLIGVSPNYMRGLKDKYPHIKMGDSKQGRVMFKRDALIQAFK